MIQCYNTLDKDRALIPKSCCKYGPARRIAGCWLICKQNVEAVTRLAIRILRESYTDAQREPLGRLLEYVAYEIEHTEK